MKSAEQSNATTQTRTFLSKIFSLESLAGDVRSAVIGAIAGSLIGAVSSTITFLFLTSAPLQYTVFVNDDGYGQPKGLFDLAERAEPKLSLTFRPAELRNAYVCEFKSITGDSWQRVILGYLDTYRDCFDVNSRSENSFVISANNRTSVLIQRQADFFCKCGVPN